MTQSKKNRKPSPPPKPKPAPLPLPASRFAVYTALFVLTYVLALRHQGVELPMPISQWAAWDESGMANLMFGAFLFGSIFVCFEWAIVSTIYVRLAQRKSAGAIGAEVLGEVVEIGVDALLSGSSGSSSSSSSGSGYSGGGGSSGGGGASGSF